MPSLLPVFPLLLLASAAGATFARSDAAPSPALRAAPALGPPAICFPLEVSGRTLPWGDGPMRPDQDFAIETLPELLPGLLDGQDVLTRMENLRRTAILLGPMGNKKQAVQAARTRTAVLSLLRARALQALLDAPDAPATAHRVFDLGYLQAGLAQIDFHGASEEASAGFGTGARELLHAGKKLPRDGAIALGITLGNFDMRRAAHDPEALKRCVRAAAQDPLLRKNLMSTVGSFLGVRDYDALVARIDD